MTGRADRRPTWPGLHLFTATLGVILAAATRPAGGRRPAPRRRPRACGPEPEGPGLDLRTLVERCRLQLFVGCLACERFVKLDGVASFKRCGWRVSIRELRRRLFCCKCRSRTRWVLLGAWPPAGGGVSPQKKRRDNDE